MVREFAKCVWRGEKGGGGVAVRRDGNAEHEDKIEE